MGPGTWPQGHPGRDVTRRWALDQGVDMTIEAITLMNVKRDIIKWAKWLKPPWNKDSGGATNEEAQQIN